MGDPLFLGALLVLALGIAAAMRYRSTDARTRRALKAAPILAISAVQEDAVVRVTGRLRPIGDLIAAPLTGRRCAYYLAVVEEHLRTGNTWSWVEVAREADGVDFLVEDATGVLRIGLSAECRVAVTRDGQSRSGTFDDANEVEKAFLGRVYVEDTGALGFNRSLRYTEGILGPGEEITALGRARRGADGVMALGPRPDGPVLISDDRETVARR